MKRTAWIIALTILLSGLTPVALAQQEPVPYELEKEGVYAIGSPFTDYYCGLPGRYDPACAKLIGFMMGKPKPGCYDGLNIPAAPKPPKVVLCNYVMPINRDTPQKYSRRYTYWYQRVPNNLDSLRVYGVDQFTSIAPVAVEACPKDARAADRLSGDRRGVPAFTASTRVGRLIRQQVYSQFDMPGTDVLVAESQQAQLMPEPPLSARNPQCEDTPVAQSTNISQNLEEGDYELLHAVAPVYPGRMASRGVQGQVEVSFTFSASGVVTDPVVVSSPNAGFSRAAIKAVLKYKYKPRVVDGQAVEVTGVTKTVVFKLDE